MEKIYLKSKNENPNFAIRKCIEFLKNNGWTDIALGRHDIKDTEIYAMVSEYNTRFFEESNWEAHKKYADLQVVLDGEENIFVSDISSMKTGEYHSDSDYLECDGDVEETVYMDSTIGLLLMPEDVHMPGICVNAAPSYVKKCVFKIPIDYLRI
jgi:YhcH/YjgK/YiaL family protein